MKRIYKRRYELAPLYCKYIGHSEPQKAHIIINFEDKTIDADYKSNNSFSTDISKGYSVEIEISAYAEEHSIINTIDEIIPVAEELFNIYESHHDHGCFADRDKARSLLHAIEEICNKCETIDKYDEVVEFCGDSIEITEKEIKIDGYETITSKTTNEEIEEIAEGLIEEAKQKNILLEDCSVGLLILRDNLE